MHYKFLSSRFYWHDYDNLMIDGSHPDFDRNFFTIIHKKSSSIAYCYHAEQSA
jgi:hypothetical protein